MSQYSFYVELDTFIDCINNGVLLKIGHNRVFQGFCLRLCSALSTAIVLQFFFFRASGA